MCSWFAEDYLWHWGLLGNQRSGIYLIIYLFTFFTASYMYKQLLLSLLFHLDWNIFSAGFGIHSLIFWNIKKCHHHLLWHCDNVIYLYLHKGHYACMEIYLYMFIHIWAFSQKQTSAQMHIHEALLTNKRHLVCVLPTNAIHYITCNLVLIYWWAELSHCRNKVVT